MAVTSVLHRFELLYSIRTPQLAKAALHFLHFFLFIYRTMRKIIHVDMDCFYAAIEIRNNPHLKGKPVAVSGASARSVLSTCNYEARRFGCRSAMPTFHALRLCPNLIIVPHHFDLYREESRKIRAIFADYTDLIEPLSLDEAFLDVTANERFAWDIAKEIRQRIFQETQLTASAGVASNKLLAKIASDLKKPNGQAAILPKDAESFMATLPIRKLWGIGPKTEAVMKRLGFNTCGDVQKLTHIQLIKKFERFGGELYFLCRGIDDRPVETDYIPQSLSTERTFERDLMQLEELFPIADRCWEEVQEDLKKSRYRQRKIHKAFVKVKFSDFSRTTKECICGTPNLNVFYTLLAEAKSRRDLPVRLIGLGVRFLDETTGITQLILPGFDQYS